MAALYPYHYSFLELYNIEENNFIFPLPYFNHQDGVV